MLYNNPIYNLFNMDYIQQQCQQQYHINQQAQVLETAKKLKDFLDSFDKVDDAYKSELLAYCSAVLIDHEQKHSK